MSTATLQGEMAQNAIEIHIEPFLDHLRAAGYAERTLRKKRTVTKAFARWTKQKGISTDDLFDGHVAAFVGRSPRRRKAHVGFELAVMRLFFGYMRSQAVLENPLVEESTSAADSLLGSYEEHLRNDRGLAENSLHVYVPLIRELLTSQAMESVGASPQSLNTLIIRDFVLDHTCSRSAEYRRLLSTALRSFFRFLFLSGRVLQDLSSAVPTVRKYRQSTPPAFLSPEQIELVLTAMDCSTPTGLRDHAILLLLARLGLRASEVVSLEIDDIYWRTAELVVRGKGRLIDRLPLLSDVGEALAMYLCEGRGATSSRRIFLRTFAPRTGLTGPAAVGHIVRRALVRAGIRRSGRGAAHLFRHGLGTRMIRHGASMAEISEVLRHRSPTTTAIYTQVAFEALRDVALPWPVAGGER